MRFGVLDDGMCTVSCFLGRSRGAYSSRGPAALPRPAWWFDGRQAMPVELADAPADNRESFCREKPSLQLRIRTIAADVPACCHHAVIGESGNLQTAHQVAHGSGGARLARNCRDVTVC